MSRIIELLDSTAVKRLLDQYCAFSGEGVALLDAEKNLIISSPEGMSPCLDRLEPVMLRGDLIGYAAQAAGAGGRCLEQIADNLAMTLDMGFEIESLSSEVARNYEEFSLLWKLSSRLGFGLDVDNICRVLTEEVMGICPSSCVAILLVEEMPSDDFRCGIAGCSVNKTGGSIRTKASLGRYAPEASGLILNQDRGLLSHANEIRQPVTIFDVASDKRFERFPFPVKSLLLVPLFVDDIPIGALLATDKLDGREFYATEIKLVFSIASECATSIRKAFLYDELREMLFSAAESFASAIDAKDSYTYGHSKRVSELSVGVAREAGIPAETLNWIKLAALLHDIGKIGTPEIILNKKGRLDTREMDLMREHPVIGARIVEHIPRFRELSRWILHHHERFDGKGYPYGLSGEDIPLAARIIAIPDNYDALTTDRPYRRAMSFADAMKIMSEGKGSIFDPYLLERFERIIA